MSGSVIFCLVICMTNLSTILKGQKKRVIMRMIVLGLIGFMNVIILPFY